MGRGLVVVLAVALFASLVSLGWIYFTVTVPLQQRIVAMEEDLQLLHEEVFRLRSQLVSIRERELEVTFSRKLKLHELDWKIQAEANVTGLFSLPCQVVLADGSIEALPEGVVPGWYRYLRGKVTNVGNRPIKKALIIVFIFASDGSFEDYHTVLVEEFSI